MSLYESNNNNDNDNNNNDDDDDDEKFWRHSNISTNFDLSLFSWK